MLETQIAPFFIESNPSEHVKTKAKQLTSTKKDTAEKINIILSFIQKDIGYLSNEGVIPTRPETVLRQKFGDCKSKSLLAVNMLKSLGIESWPVIVASKGLDFRLNNLPSLSLYDHAIIEYRYKGQNYFFDTTFPEQGGNYTQKYVPNYMQGLRLSRDKELKVNINLNDPTKNIIHDSLYFGKNKKYIHIQRKTDFYGRDADNLRTIFSKGKEEAAFSQIRNLNWWFSPYFTSLLDEEDSLSIFTFISYKDHFENNASQNKVSIVYTRTYLRHRILESYKKKKHTIKYKKEILLRMNHLTKYIKPFNKVPKGQKYIKLPFPLAIEHHIHIPKSWKIEKDLQKAKEIRHDAFMYSYTKNNTGDHQVISF